MYAQFNHFEIQMTLKQAQSASHSGQCDDDVKALLQLPKIKRQLVKIPDNDLQAELKEYGAWDSEELANRQDNENRIVWIAACDIAEEHATKGQNK